MSYAEDGQLSCLLCGRSHQPKYEVCFKCRAQSGQEDTGRGLRIDTMIRDEFSCQRCRSDIDTRVVHIKPIPVGGLPQPWNLHVLCRDCATAQGTKWQRGSLRDRARTRLMHRYFTFGWCLLDDGQREALRKDAAEYHSEFTHHCRYTGVLISETRPDSYYDELMVEFGDTA